MSSFLLLSVKSRFIPDISNIKHSETSSKIPHSTSTYQSYPHSQTPSGIPGHSWLRHPSRRRRLPQSPLTNRPMPNRTYRSATTANRRLFWRVRCTRRPVTSFITALSASTAFSRISGNVSTTQPVASETYLTTAGPDIGGEYSPIDCPVLYFFKEWDPASNEA